MRGGGRARRCRAQSRAARSAAPHRTHTAHAVPTPPRRSCSPPPDQFLFIGRGGHGRAASPPRARWRLAFRGGGSARCRGQRWRWHRPRRGRATGRRHRRLWATSAARPRRLQCAADRGGLHACRGGAPWLHRRLRQRHQRGRGQERRGLHRRVKTALHRGSQPRALRDVRQPRDLHHQRDGHRPLGAQGRRGQGRDRGPPRRLKRVGAPRPPLAQGRVRIQLPR